jgi:hypothetical protein
LQTHYVHDAAQQHGDGRATGRRDGRAAAAAAAGAAV